MPRLFLLALALSQFVRADSSGFMLGFAGSVNLEDFVGSGWITATGTDQGGFFYFMEEAPSLNAGPPPGTHVLGELSSGPLLLKFNPQTGQRIWLTLLGIVGLDTMHMAVSPDGHVYIAYTPPGPDGCAITNNCFPLMVAELTPDGTAIASHVAVAPGLTLESMTVDAKGRLWLAGDWSPDEANGKPLSTTPDAVQKTVPDPAAFPGFVIRLNAVATGIEYATYLGGSGDTLLSAITTDPSGLVYVAGSTSSSDFPLSGAVPGTAVNGFIAQMASDGSRLMYAAAVGTDEVSRLAVDPAGNAVVIVGEDQTATIVRLDPKGNIVFSQPSPFAVESRVFNTNYPLATDSAGKIYVGGPLETGNYRVKNTLAPCGSSGSSVLTVLAPDGSVLQSTWLPGVSVWYVGSGTGDGSVYFVTELYAQEPLVLARLFPAVPATPLALACVTDPVYYDSSPPIAPGEIVTLFGSGLGPPTGAIPPVTVQSGYPKEFAGVQVTFDGQPAPLLYVSDGQINAVVPWAAGAGGSTRVCAAYNGTPSNCAAEQTVPAAPVVFAGSDGYALALNQDGTVNTYTHPATPGDIVSIFATGMGFMNPSPQDGAVSVPPLPLNVVPVSAQSCTGVPFFGGTQPQQCVPLTVQYAGPAPFQVAGLTQINIEFNAQAPSSDITLTVGAASIPVSIHVRGYGLD